MKGRKEQYPTKSISTFIRSLIGMELLTHRVPHQASKNWWGGLSNAQSPSSPFLLVFSPPLFLSLSLLIYSKMKILYTFPKLCKNKNNIHSLERATPQSFFTFPTSLVNLFDPFSRPANSTATPIK